VVKKNSNQFGCIQSIMASANINP